MNLFLCMVLESGAILWDWALNLWDLTLPPGSHYQNKLNCRTPGKKSCTFGDQKCQKCCECDSLVRVNEKHKERKTGLFYLKWKHSGSKKYIHKNRSDEVITDNLSQKILAHAFFFQACSFSSDLAQVCCQASLSFPPLSFSQRLTFSCPSSDAADEDQRGTEMTVLWHSNMWLTRKTPPGRSNRCLGSPPTPELKQPHWTHQAPKTKPLLVRLSLLSPSNPSSQVPESSSTLSHLAGLRCIWIHISNGRSKQPPSFDVYMA